MQQRRISLIRIVILTSGDLCGIMKRVSPNDVDMDYHNALRRGEWDD